MITKPDTQHIRQYLRLYLVMGSVNCNQPPEEVLKSAIAGGITLFQFREKGVGALTGQAYYKLAERLQQICHTHQIPFIVNDDVELAIALNADGIHVGQEDAPADQIRARLGDDKIIGVSAHSVAEARQAIEDGADYLGIGPIYPTISKADAQAVQGTSTITALKNHHIEIPLVGIGGIHAGNAEPIFTAGADGIAVISAIAGQTDIEQATQQLNTLTRRLIAN
ncbi:thiamine phosphate synthase [Paenibacillus kyungheensis]|uniref:Thiamine-phosphate synthase n=1 Tax=Paenibacillus kyungheensis TaxID=1452732 RepID=A0AAX3M3Z4_9BACL|nr:thiamine phosphate synthase [Paenibacillus kyungheensis]WCT56640.1 thiamine phosphate synthase [Paenibacillus kyungheensis]